MAFKHRYIRLRLKNGKFVHVKDRVRSFAHLWKVVKKNEAVDVYCSVSRWLNPSVVGAKKFCKPGYAIADNCFLGMDFVMDFDEKNEEMKSKAEKELELLGFKNYSCVETEKGYHLWVHDFLKDVAMPEIPNAREDWALVAAKFLTHYLRSKGIKWDYAVSCDTRRVVRVPGFENRRGFLCQQLYEVYLPPKENGIDSERKMMKAGISRGNEARSDARYPSGASAPLLDLGDFA